MKNFAVWFDIPVRDLDRAMKFYSKVFGVEVSKMEGAPKKYAMFPFAPGIASGGLVEDKEMVTDKGTLLYLNGGEDLSIPLKQVEGAGGKIVQEKTSIGAHGFMAIFRDSEGNRIALHSVN